MKEIVSGVIRVTDKLTVSVKKLNEELMAYGGINLLKRPAWKPPEILVREGGLEYKNWKSKGGD